MAQIIAWVVETDDKGHAMVVAEKGHGCATCGAMAQCHGGSPRRSGRTPAVNQAGAMVGDRVTLTTASGALLARLAVLYLVPVAGMLAGAFTGVAMDGGGGMSVGLGLGGFALGLVSSVVISRVWSAMRPITPVISRIVNTRATLPTTPPPSGCASCGH